MAEARRTVYRLGMTEDERKEAIQQHVAVCLGERDHAEDGLVKIKAGWTFHEANGDEPMRDVTEQRAGRFRNVIERMDSIIAAYRRWND